MIGDGKTILDLSKNHYSEVLRRGKIVLDSLAFEVHFTNYAEDSDHALIMQLENDREEQYEWMRENAPGAIPWLDKACIDLLTA